jgi:hypothetical protein
MQLIPVLHLKVCSLLDLLGRRVGVTVQRIEGG